MNVVRFEYRQVFGRVQATRYTPRSTLAVPMATVPTHQPFRLSSNLSSITTGCAAAAIVEATAHSRNTVPRHAQVPGANSPEIHAVRAVLRAPRRESRVRSRAQRPISIAVLMVAVKSSNTGMWDSG